MTAAPAQSRRLQEALALSELGPVFPLKPGAKTPATAHGFHDASTDPDQITKWWTETPNANIALVTGKSFAVIDEDKAGAIAKLEEKHGALPATVTSKTGGGGRQLFFRVPVEIRNSAGKIAQGVDVRGDGGYVVAPPSVHPSGTVYRWAPHHSPTEIELAELPEKWLDALTSKGRRASSNSEAVAQPSAILDGARNSEFARIAGAMRRVGATREEIEAALLAANERCRPPLPDDEARQVAASIARYEPEPAPGSPSAAPKSDLDNARKFAVEHADRFRYVPEQRKWYFLNKRWARDATGDAERAAKRTARGFFETAAQIDDPDERKAALKWALTSQSEPRIFAMLRLASTEPELAIPADALDRDPWMLSCENGVLDLRTGKLGPHRPADLISLGVDITFDSDATCPRWEKFLAEVFDGDEELIEFVWRFIGYCLTGDTREQVLAVFHGAGANGKSTLIAVLRQLLGDHALTSAFDTFTRQRDGGPRNDLARLHRARLVTASESAEGRRLDEATVKEITGGDRVAARFLYGEHFEFVPRFKLILVSNHRPRVDADDDAVWRRLRLVPFEQSFEGREDRELGTKLEAELSGILTWAVRGCLEWQRTGLGQAAAVVRATAEYRRDEDTLGLFLDERCTLSGEVTTERFRRSYELFCEDLGETPLTAVAVGKRLAKRGIRREQQSDGRRARIYDGLSLK
jgi:putative DNA primase/helicase